MNLQIQRKKQEILLTKCLMIFMIIQPFLDCRFWFEDERFQVFGLTVPTLFRCFGIMLLFMITLYRFQWKREYIFYILYFGCLGIYYVVHHVVATGNLEMPSHYQYSVVGELFYIVRMLFPFVIVYLMKIARMSYERFVLTIQIVSIIIGLIIIISNLFHISLTSYYTSTTYNRLNFIEWFTVGPNAYVFEEMTSKGWFFMANQIGALMFMLLPINLYDFLTRQTKISVISTFSLAISMLLLGTRVATYGCLAYMIIFTVMFVFFKVVKKEQLMWKHTPWLAVLTICVVVLFWNSPINNRVYYYGEVNTENLGDELEDLVADSQQHDNSDAETYILEHYRDFKIADIYLFEIYPYNEDTQFWLDFMNEYQGEVQNSRQMQKLLVQRIEDLNDTALNKLFGSSYTRYTSGGLYLEQDVAVHYYTIGIFGILLLLGPWLYYLLKSVWDVLKNFKEKFTFLNCTLLGSILACFLAACFSGHVLDELIVTLFLGFVVGFIRINIESEIGNEKSQYNSSNI